MAMRPQIRLAPHFVVSHFSVVLVYVCRTLNDRDHVICCYYKTTRRNITCSDHYYYYLPLVGYVYARGNSYDSSSSSSSTLIKTDKPLLNIRNRNVNQ